MHFDMAFKDFTRLRWLLRNNSMNAMFTLLAQFIIQHRFSGII